MENGILSVEERIDQMYLRRQYERIKALEEIELEQAAKQKEYWEPIRIQAAIAAMQGYIGGNSALGMDEAEIAQWAVKQADALIEELKKEK